MSTAPETDEKLSFSDLVNSLTGYEEIAIEERFGQPIGRLMNGSLSKAGRALIFVHELRQDDGKKPEKAFKAAMTLRLVDVNDRFFDENEDADDFDADDPDTAQGKDDSPSD